VKPFNDRYKRVAQNILKRKEKERKEKLEKQKEKLLYESLELEEEEHEEAVNSSPMETTKNDNQQPLQPLLNNNQKSKKPIPAKPSIFEKLHWKTTFQETSQEMKGKALYDIYVPPLPPPIVDPVDQEKMKKGKKTKKSEGSEEKKEKEQQEQEQEAAAKKWENDYLQKLFDQTTAVDTNMSSRIHPPVGLLENYPIAQLLVMDVYLQLPKPNKQQPPDSASARRGSVTSSSSGATAALFPVEIHQIIGLFPAENGKCPANLDCGLFDYEYFHGLYEEQQRRLLNPQSYNDDDNHSVGSNSSLTSSLTGVTNTGGGLGGSGALAVTHYMMKEKSFSAPDANTGISAGKTRLPSVINSGMEFRYHLLGQWPNKEYLEKNLPRKVKNWLGLPV
jgi:hypothetical protein